MVVAMGGTGTHWLESAVSSADMILQSYNCRRTLCTLVQLEVLQCRMHSDISAICGRG